MYGVKPLLYIPEDPFKYSCLCRELFFQHTNFSNRRTKYHMGMDGQIQFYSECVYRLRSSRLSWINGRYLYADLKR